VLQIAKTRILKTLARLGAVEVRPDALAVDDAWAARDPVMAHLAAAAVAGLPPAGLAERKRAPVSVVDGGQPEIVSELVVQGGVDSHFERHFPSPAESADNKDTTDFPPTSISSFMIAPTTAFSSMSCLAVRPQE
jgi:hypothetical protein